MTKLHDDPSLDDPFALRADIDDFEKKLLARVRADAEKKQKATTRRSMARPSLRHLDDPLVRADIARLIQVKRIEFSHDPVTCNSRLVLVCHCDKAVERLVADEVIAAMRTADEVNSIFENLDSTLRTVCKCSKPRPFVNMR